MQRIIVDLDVGTDDAFALLVLLFAEKIGKIKVEAIVCTMGNTYIQHVCQNVIRLLEVLGRTDIPVYKGASEPLIPLPQHLPQNYFFHGKDGFGDLEHDENPDLSIIRNVTASVAINELVMQNPGEFTLVCIGPLTNVALTIQNCKHFLENLKDIYALGGNHKGIGNITNAAEFNFYVDPKSANIVLTNTITPVTLLTWETSLDTSINLEWRYNILGILQSPFIKLLNKVEESVYKGVSLDELWITPDVFLVIALLYPEAILEKVTGDATVEIESEKNRGQVLFTPSKENKNLTVITKINAEIVKEVLLEAVSTYFRL